MRPWGLSPALWSKESIDSFPLVSTQNWPETLPHPDATFISCPGLWVYIIEWSSTYIAYMCSWIQSPAQQKTECGGAYLLSSTLGYSYRQADSRSMWAREVAKCLSTGSFPEDPGLNPSMHSGIHNCL